MICRENRKPLCKNRSKNNIDVSRRRCRRRRYDPVIVFRDVSRYRETLDDLSGRADARITRQARLRPIVRSARARELHLEPRAHVASTSPSCADDARVNGRTLIICISVLAYLLVTRIRRVS